MKFNKLKILLLGPSGSGKTLLSNFLSDAVNVEEAAPPKSTKGLRIVEFEHRDVNVNGNSINIDIELWDCSGDHRYESCWPALRQNTHGVILVCSPSTSHIASKELELLYNYFVAQPKLMPKQCVMFFNCSEESDDVDCLNLSSTFTKVSQVAVNARTGKDRLKIDFDKFISSVLASIITE